MPRMRFVLGDVHRQLDELPDRSAGISLPGNGTVVATHVNRRRLFEDAAALIVRNAERYYFEGDDSVLPRSVATKAAFENAMSLDIAMGGSTNTVLHLLAVAHEAGVDFTMQDIDRLSRRVPVLCKVAPTRITISRMSTVRAASLSIPGRTRPRRTARHLGREGRRAHARPGHRGLRPAERNSEQRSQTGTTGAPAGLTAGNWAQRTYYDTPDTDRTAGCIRDLEHAYFRDGGLAVLTGNIARRGCIVKTAGVDASCLSSAGAPRYESQEQAIGGILGGEVQAGDVVIIRYEGPKGRPRDAGDALPHVVPQIQTPRQSLRADYRRPLLGRNVGVVDRSRFARKPASGGRSPSSARRRDRIDIPRRSIRLMAGDEEIAARMAAQQHFRPRRDRRTRVAKGLCPAGQLGRQRGRTHRRRRIKPDNTMNTNTTTRTEGQQPGPCITGVAGPARIVPARGGVDTLFGYPGGAIIPRLRCAFRLPRPAAPHPCPP